MAGDAVLLEDAGHVAMIGDRRGLGVGGGRQIQFAAGGGGGLHEGLFAAKQGGYGVPQIRVLGRIEVIVDPVLVVERATIDQRSRRIDQEYLRGGASVQRQAEPLFDVVHIGRGDAGGGQLGADILGLLAAEGVDEQQPESLVLEFRGQFGHRGQVAFADGAGGARHDDDESLAVLERAEAEFLAVQRAELHVVDHTTDADFAGFEHLRPAGDLLDVLGRDRGYLCRGFFTR